MSFFKTEAFTVKETTSAEEKSDAAVGTEVDSKFYGFTDILIHTLDDYGFMDSFEFELTDGFGYSGAGDDVSVWSYIEEGEMSILYEDTDRVYADDSYNLYYAIFEEDDPEFSFQGYTDEAGLKSEILAYMPSVEKEKLKELYGNSGSDVQTTLKDAIVSMAEEVYTATIANAHTSKTIKPPPPNQEMFDAFEGQVEKAEGLRVTTTATTTTY